MKHALFALAAALLAANGLNAEYPRDAGQRFKMKFGNEHPVVVQEAREKLEARTRFMDGGRSKRTGKAGEDSARAENCGSAPCKVDPPVSR